MAKRDEHEHDQPPPGQQPPAQAAPPAEPRPQAQGTPQINVVMPTPGIAPSPTPDLDKAPPGGRYKVGDRLVDAQGKPIEETKAGKAGD